MQTPFEPHHHGGASIQPLSPPRSVFANFNASTAALSRPAPADLPANAALPSDSSNQADPAMARAFLFRFLAKAFEYPDPAGWEWLSSPETKTAFRVAVHILAPDGNDPLRAQADRFILELLPENFQPFLFSHIAAFGHTSRGACPPNEIDYGGLKADPLFQPHRLADLAAFYRVFGLELGEDATERHDHLCLELEFMSVLAAKEAYALEHQLSDKLAICCQAQKEFLSEHLGAWVPAFTRRLGQSDHVMCSLAALLEEFVRAECQRFHSEPGSKELLLRPVDEEASSPCASCGLSSLPPGALPSA